MRTWRDPTRVLLALAAPLVAVLFAVAITSLVLRLAGDPVGLTWSTILESGGRPRAQVQILNGAVVYYFAALAVAIGFRMNLFNIGVEGQYRAGVFAAAVVGGAVTLPRPLHVGLTVLVGMAVGAALAGVAAVLKVTRGVSEVISTIMLNAIATVVVASLLRRVAVGDADSNNIATATIPESGRVGGLPLVPGAPNQVYGFAFAAVLAGVGYWLLLGRTRFGFDLRATGRSESAAVASGVSVPRMVVASMLLSGAVAGLVGMPQLLGEAYSYSLTVPAGFGFTGIAIALLGRNSAVGMALGALLFSYLDVTSNPLQIRADVAPEIVTITQGVIVLSVVIAYELVRRYGVAREQRRVSRQLDPDAHVREPQEVGA